MQTKTSARLKTAAAAACTPRVTTHPVLMNASAGQDSRETATTAIYRSLKVRLLITAGKNNKFLKIKMILKFVTLTC